MTFRTASRTYMEIVNSLPHIQGTRGSRRGTKRGKCSQTWSKSRPCPYPQPPQFCFGPARKTEHSLRVPWASTYKPGVSPKTPHPALVLNTQWHCAILFLLWMGFLNFSLFHSHTQNKHLFWLHSRRPYLSLKARWNEGVVLVLIRHCNVHEVDIIL